MCLPIRATSEPSGQTELQSTPRTQTVQTCQPGRRYYIPTNVHDTQGTEYQYRCKPRTSFHDSSIPSSSPFSRSYNNRDKKREPIILACPVRTNSPQRGTRLFDQKSGKQPRERERYEGTERGCTLRPVSATLMTFFFFSLFLSLLLFEHAHSSRDTLFFFFFYHTEFEFESPDNRSQSPPGFRNRIDDAVYISFRPIFRINNSSYIYKYIYLYTYLYACTLEYWKLNI